MYIGEAACERASTCRSRALTPPSFDTHDVRTPPVKKTAPADADPAAAAANANAAAAGSDDVSADAAAAAGPAPMWLKDESLSAEESQLRQFDLDKRYGPCVGMTRTERWRRAEELGRAPPPAVLALLQAGAGERCLWEGRV